MLGPGPVLRITDVAVASLHSVGFALRLAFAEFLIRLPVALVFGVGFWGAVSASQPAWAIAPGHLQVAVPPGVQAVVDGQPRGEGQDNHGVIVRNLEPGPHQVTLRKPGSKPQHAIVHVAPGEVTVHRPAPWAKLDSTEDSQSGMLMLQTLPFKASIKARSLGWKKVMKGPKPFRTSVPAGQHRMTICNEYRCITYRVTVEPGRLRSLLVDLDEGFVEDLSVVHVAEWEQKRQACTRGLPGACRQACEWDSALRPEQPSSACRSLLPSAVVEAPGSESSTSVTDAPAKRETAASAPKVAAVPAAAKRALK